MAIDNETLSITVRTKMTKFEVVTHPEVAVQLWYTRFFLKEDGTIIKAEPILQVEVATLQDLEQITPGIAEIITAIADHFNPTNPELS